MYLDGSTKQSLFLCSAGVGRTGVFISLSIVLERMQYEGVVDLFQTVRTLRTQRTFMVQTEVSACTQRTFMVQTEVCT
jgi:protein tyrosine phosphatase